MGGRGGRRKKEKGKKKKEKKNQATSCIEVPFYAIAPLLGRQIPTKLRELAQSSRVLIFRFGPTCTLKSVQLHVNDPPPNNAQTTERE